MKTESSTIPNKKIKHPLVIPTHAQCEEVLRSKKIDIIEEFKIEARANVPAAFDKDTIAIVDSLPKIIDRLVVALKPGSSANDAQSTSEICREHGEQRAKLKNYTLEQVLFEYTLLRRIILETLRAETTVTVEESEIIHEAIEAGKDCSGVEFIKYQAIRLREAEEFAAQILESSEDCYKVLDLDGKLLVLAEASKKHLEVEDTGPLIGKSWLRFWERPEDYEAAQKAVKAAAQGGKGHFIGYYPTPSRKRLWWDIVITPIPGVDGKPEKLLAISRDVTEFRKIQEELRRESDKIYSLIMQAPFNVAILSGKELRYEIFNPGIERLLKEVSKVSSLAGKTFKEVSPKSPIFEVLQNIFVTKKSVIYRDTEVTYTDDKGRSQRRYFDWIAQPLIDANGEVNNIISLSIETTEKVLAKKELEASSEQFRALADMIPQLAWKAHPDGSRYWFNNRWYEYTGLTFEESQGFGWLKAHHPDFKNNVFESYKKAFQAGVPWEETYPVKSKTGDWKWYLVRAVPIYDAGGNIIKWFGTNTDITEQKKSEIEKAKTTEVLSIKNRELDRFAAIAAHDLKSPLNSITQFTDLLREQYKGKFDEEADQYLDFIINSGNRLKSLIDNLLEFSRAGSIDRSKFKPIQIAEVVGAVRKNLFNEIEKTDARITLKPKPPTVLGNEFQITQLFQNLIANAIKFRKPHSQPIVQIAFKSHENFWLFSVEDQGIGIAEENKEKIFEIFNKLHGTSQYEGSGIGLAVCKKIVEAHEGKIWVESQPGVGSKFFFTLPKA